MNRNLQIEYVAVSDLVPYARNARTHSAEQVAVIAASIQRFGWTNPVLIGNDNDIIAGHGRVLAATSLGIKVVPILRIGDLTAEERRAYLIADNQTALRAGWDLDVLRLELGELKEMDFDLAPLGFDDAELASILDVRPVGATDPDEVPDVPANPVATRGDLWALGRHRLLCGDATSADDVAKVLGGAKPKLMVTDPPYGVSLDMEWRDRAGLNNNAPAEASYMRQRVTEEHASVSISGDTRADWSEAFALVPSLSVAYVWHATSHSIEVGLGLRAIGFDLRQQIIWNKPFMVISRQAYHWKHEPCWYAVRKGKTATWKGDNKQTTVWDATSPKHIYGHSDEVAVDHPTQKPIVLYNRPIENHTVAGDSMYEPFSGSGTAIIACEQLGRSCRAIEIDPKFVDVAVMRFTNFTGSKDVSCNRGGVNYTYEELLALQKRQAAG